MDPAPVDHGDLSRHGPAGRLSRLDPHSVTKFNNGPREKPPKPLRLAETQTSHLLGSLYQQEGNPHTDPTESFL